MQPFMERVISRKSKVIGTLKMEFHQSRCATRGPFGANWMIRRLVRYLLLAEPLLEEYAALFKGMSKSEIDEMMQSFHFKQCVHHTELANILAESPRESSRS